MNASIVITLMGAALMLSSFGAGVLYEGRRAAQVAQQEIRDQQQRTARTIAWIQDAKAKSEDALRTRIDVLQNDLSTAQVKANEEHHTRNAGVRAGTVSVRVPIVPASCPASPDAAAPGHAAAEPAAAHAQLDPAAAADLATITHEGDASIRDLNHCIAKYNAVKVAHDAWRLKLEGGAHAQTR